MGHAHKGAVKRIFIQNPRFFSHRYLIIKNPTAFSLSVGYTVLVSWLILFPLSASHGLSLKVKYYFNKYNIQTLACQGYILDFVLGILNLKRGVLF
jgi:hypothetical protein